MVSHADIDRAASDILGALHCGGELTLAEVAKNTKLPYSTVARVIVHLTDQHQVENRLDDATGMTLYKRRPVGILSKFQDILGV